MITKVRGVCPHDCPDSCGLVSEVENEKVVAFYGDPGHPVTEGWLCAKVRPYLNHVYHPGRITTPLKRNGPKGSGQWQPISWEAAMAEITGRWQTIIAHYGPQAILPYSYSGTLGLVQMGVASSRFWNRLGASQLQRSICGAAAEMAVEITLGARYSPPYDHLRHSRLLILWGHNPVSTAPHLMPHLKAAQRQGCQLVVIDPRQSRTAKGADWWLAPRPGTDGALALGMAHLLVANGWHDESWLEANAIGWPALRQRLADYPPERVAAITGLSVADLETLTQLYAHTRPGLIKIADGLNRNRHGGQNVRAILTLPALTGQYGALGGGLAYSTSGYFGWDREAIHHWADCPPPGRSVNMNRLGAALLGEISNPPIMALYVFGANPAGVNPNAGKVVSGLQRDDLFTVVHELFMTDTADYADLILPATSQLEQADLHKSYGHTHLAYNHPAIPPLGQSKSNWEVMGLLAAGMGFHESWLQQSPDEVIDEILTATNNPTVAGITLARLKAEGSVPLQLPDTVPFADGRFPTPGGKVALYAQALADLGHDPLPGWVEDEDDGDSDKYPAGEALTLISPAAHHFVSSSFANQADLLAHEGTPFLEIHPTDAAKRHIVHGQLVRVENGRGCCQLRAVLTEGVRPGVVASPKGRWSKLDGGQNINWLTSDALADLAGQSTFHSNKVWVCPAGSIQG